MTFKKKLAIVILVILLLIILLISAIFAATQTVSRVTEQAPNNAITNVANNEIANTNTEIMNNVSSTNTTNDINTNANINTPGNYTPSTYEERIRDYDSLTDVEKTQRLDLSVSRLTFTNNDIERYAKENRQEITEDKKNELLTEIKTFVAALPVGTQNFSSLTLDNEIYGMTVPKYGTYNSQKNILLVTRPTGVNLSFISQAKFETNDITITDTYAQNNIYKAQLTVSYKYNGQVQSSKSNTVYEVSYTSEGIYDLRAIS